jgi:hypothetical protein
MNMNDKKKTKSIMKKAWNEWQKKRRKYYKLNAFVSAVLARRKYLYNLWFKHKNKRQSVREIFFRQQAARDAKLNFVRRLFMKYKRDYDRFLTGVDPERKQFGPTDWFLIGFTAVVIINMWWNS